MSGSENAGFILWINLHIIPSDIRSSLYVFAKDKSDVSVSVKSLTPIRQA
jgi:hypothetical protein